MNIWHHELNNPRLSETTKSLKTELASAPLCKLAQVTTYILKIHGLHLWKDDKTLNKTYVGLKFIRCTHQSWEKMTKVHVLVRI